METNYILVKGQMHVGAENCLFTKQAQIYLYGKSDTPHEVEEFGRKFIGVAEGGTLEIHGRPKTSWTKLTTSVGVEKECHVIYDSQDKAFSKERSEGIHVTVWNLDGSLFDATIFATEHSQGHEKETEAFAKYIQELPSNRVVGLSVYRDLGNTALAQQWSVVYSAIQRLGGSSIRGVRTKEPYAFVGITGSDPIQFEESHVSRPSSSPDDTLTAKATLTIGDVSKITFTITSSTTPGGMPNIARFRIVPYDSAFPVLNLLDDVSSWEPGDQIVVASTDYTWDQAEVKTIVNCDECSSNQVRVKGEFEFLHFGEITYGVDERGEVGLLTRNIKVEGSLEDSCYGNTPHETLLCSRLGRDTFGGHVKVLRGHESVHIQGVELYHMGQQAFLGSYPLHFHMCDDVTGMWLRHNSIHDSLARCVTIHGTDGLEVSNNVCYLHLGHGFFLEDSVEQNNTLHRNLGIGTTFGHHILSDMKAEWCDPTPRKSCGHVATFWLTHGNNIVTDNVAAGSDRHGFMYSFSDVPLGPSYQRQLERQMVSNYSTRYTRIKEFSGNTAHSNHFFGLNIEGIISHGRYDDDVYIPENGLLLNTPSQYSARDPPNADGQKIDTVLERLRFYKNNKMDAWVRGGNIIIKQSSFADSPIGFISAHNAGESSCDVRDSLFIGQTDNLGQPFVYRNRTGVFSGKHWSDMPAHSFSQSIAGYKPEDYVSAIAFYQGPMYVDNCYFDRYYNWFYNDSFQDTWGFRPVRPGAAISFHRSAGYYSQVFSGLSNLRFGYCDDSEDRHYVIAGNASTRAWSHLDGSITATFRDYDGSLTGYPGAQIVRDTPFFTGPRCQSMAQWGMAACPYKYAAMSIIGDDGVLHSSLKRSWPTSISRDDTPDDVINLQGQTSNQWTMRSNQSYIIRFNDSLGDVPYTLRLKAFDLDRDEVLRVGLCFPKDTTKFYITGVGPIINRAKPAVLVDSVKELDEDDTGRAYYWDSTDGLLYIKVVGQGDRTNPDQFCPGDQCTILTIKRLDGGKGPAKCDDVTPIPYTGHQEDPSDIGVKKCNGKDSPEGVGALTQHDLDTAPSPVEDPQCPAPPTTTPGRGPVEYRGCFKQLYRNQDMTEAYIKLYESMTPQVCNEHCFQRGYPYSANHQGYKCQCGHSFGRSGPVAATDCSIKCKGDQTQTCGANAKYQIQTTGAALSRKPTPCGPGQRGVVYNGTCLYLSMVEEDWPYARRRCLEIGGDLAKIDSQGKQDVVEEYLLGLTYDVWAGLVWENGQWEYVDGTPLAYSNWYSPGQSTPSSKYRYYLRIIPSYQSKWFTHRFYDNNMALCDLPMTPAPAKKNCGLDSQGIKKGDTGPCMSLIHGGLKLTNAQYACSHVMGYLATADSEEDRRVVESFLLEFGARVDYWVDSGTSQSKAYDFYGNERYVLKNFGHGAELAVVCRLDDPEKVVHCPTGWSYFQGSCYLSRGDRVNTYQLVSAYCNSGNSQIVAIDNQAENDYVASLLPGKYVWLGIQYKSVTDQFTWSDNADRPFTNWYFSQPLTYLSKGLCVALDPRSKKWRNKNCNSGTASVVCEMPAVN